MKVWTTEVSVNNSKTQKQQRTIRTLCMLKILTW